MKGWIRLLSCLVFMRGLAPLTPTLSPCMGRGAIRARRFPVQDNHYDVLIIGAGLSGIGMACHLAIECPGKRVGIVERRKAIGGTWDLFRYPGI
ncbi:MAG TPA: NAD(P)-binding protein, partial [Solimonas sp.]